MCGIFCALTNGNLSEPLRRELAELLHNRGPNASNVKHVDNVICAGYVLWQQGTTVCNQPVTEEHITLLFNGDLYNIVDRKPASVADSAWLAQELSKCASDDDIVSLFRTLEGPFSFIFYNSKEGSLYFGRDALGRNSLIIEQEAGELRLSSTTFYEPSVQKCALELPPLGLYKFNVSDRSKSMLMPWSTPTEEWQHHRVKFESSFGLNMTIGTVIEPSWLSLSEARHTKFDFYELCSNLNTTNEQLFELLSKEHAVLTSLTRFDQLLAQSVRDRVLHTPPYCRNCIATHQTQCKHAKVAILFSGGIDCSILALLADKFIDASEPIELINVAFERVQGNKFVTTDDWLVPDRISAQESLKELQSICPSREWQLIEVNVTRKELDNKLAAHVKHLIYPLNTVLDESIGCAFWFASRGLGTEANSTARVIIIGSGADELFGGYIRHRNAYKRCQGSETERQAAVHAELEHDWLRIPSRNLARDDRAIADNGKTSRAPFIEEHVVQFVRGLTPSQRCCFELPEGLGDKLFLRLYGYQLGLRMPAQLKKRAIQFGSRIANKKQNAQDVSTYLRFEESLLEGS